MGCLVQHSAQFMKILIVSRNFPSDFHTKVHGAFQRLRMFVDSAKEIAEIDMLFYVSSDLAHDVSYVKDIQESFLEFWNVKLTLFLCQRRKRHFSSTQRGKLLDYMRESLRFFDQPGYYEVSGQEQLDVFEACLNRRPDAIVVDRLQAMCPLLKTTCALPPIFLNLDDIDHVALMRTARSKTPWHSRFLLYLRIPMVLWAERQSIQLARYTFVCSDVDRRYLEQYWRLPNVVTIPNAVRIPPHHPLTDEPTLLFIGSYTYWPNIEAAEFLLEQIWPQLQKEMPHAQLIIAGAHPEQVKGYTSHGTNIEFPGFVEDLDGLYRRSRVVCAPIFTGAGTRVKIIEAAAHGKPIVATRIGAEGIELCDGRDVLLRDSARSIVDGCLLLLRDKSLSDKLGSNARAQAIRCYDRSNVVQKIRSCLSQK